MRRALYSNLFLSVLLLSASAHASGLDLSLRGLGVETRSNTLPNERLRLLSTELAFALAPRNAGPAATLGMSGFEASVDTTIVNFGTNRDYWRGNVTDPSPVASHDAVTEQEQLGKGAPASTQGVIGFHFRKGLPFSVELGVHLNYLLNSSMFMLGADVRWALLEGYRYVPDLSVRGAAGRLIGATDLDMTTAEVSATLSKRFAVAGVFTLTPYVGYGMLFGKNNRPA